MKKWVIALIVFVALILVLFGTVKGKYNSFVRGDEDVKAAWAQVENQYQRRYDLIPNLVATVKGYAEHEKETLTAVTEARAKMGGMVKLDESVVNNPELMKQYGAMQAGLGSALQRLMVAVERYPDLKANTNFRDLQAQLEGTENRISTERRRYNETVKEFNKLIRIFPNNLFAGLFGFERAALYEMDEAAAVAPKVEF